MLTDKSKEDCFTALNLKTVLGDFLRTKLGLWVDFSLSFTLVISQFIQGNSQRKNFRLIFLIILLLIFFQDILIILLLFSFLFNRSYNVNNRLDFALTVIKRHYNTNDRLKFILSFIRWDNGLNDQLKLVKNGRKENRKLTKWRWKPTKQEMNWKSRIQKLIGWRMKNARRTDEERRRMTENLHKIAHGNVSKALRKHLGLDFLHGNMFFHPKQLKCIA